MNTWTVPGQWVRSTSRRRVWHRLFGEGVVRAVDESIEGQPVYYIDFYWKGRKAVVEPQAQLVWLDEQ